MSCIVWVRTPEIRKERSVRLHVLGTAAGVAPVVSDVLQAALEVFPFGPSVSLSELAAYAEAGFGSAAAKILDNRTLVERLLSNEIVVCRITEQLQNSNDSTTPTRGAYLTPNLPSHGAKKSTDNDYNVPSSSSPFDMPDQVAAASYLSAVTQPYTVSEVGAAASMIMSPPRPTVRVMEAAVPSPSPALGQGARGANSGTAAIGDAVLPSPVALYRAGAVSALDLMHWQHVLAVQQQHATTASPQLHHTTTSTPRRRLASPDGRLVGHHIKQQQQQQQQYSHPHVTTVQTIAAYADRYRAAEIATAQRPKTPPRASPTTSSSSQHHYRQRLASQYHQQQHRRPVMDASPRQQYAASPSSSIIAPSSSLRVASSPSYRQRLQDHRSLLDHRMGRNPAAAPAAADDARGDDVNTDGRLTVQDEEETSPRMDYDRDDDGDNDASDHEQRRARTRQEPWYLTPPMSASVVIQPFDGTDAAIPPLSLATPLAFSHRTDASAAGHRNQQRSPHRRTVHFAPRAPEGRHDAPSRRAAPAPPPTARIASTQGRRLSNATTRCLVTHTVRILISIFVESLGDLVALVAVCREFRECFLPLTVDLAERLLRCDASLRGLRRLSSEAFMCAVCGLPEGTAASVDGAGVMDVNTFRLLKVVAELTSGSACSDVRTCRSVLVGFGNATSYSRLITSLARVAEEEASKPGSVVSESQRFAMTTSVSRIDAPALPLALQPFMVFVSQLLQTGTCSKWEVAERRLAARVKALWGSP